MKPIIRTRYNYLPFKGEKNGQPSLTVPDQTMTLKVILERYARGLPVTMGNPGTPLFEGEEVDGVDIKHLDLADREDYINAKSMELQMLQDKEAEKLAKKKAANDAKRIEEKAKEYAAAKKANEAPEN